MSKNEDGIGDRIMRDEADEVGDRLVGMGNEIINTVERYCTSEGLDMNTEEVRNLIRATLLLLEDTLAAVEPIPLPEMAKA
jgi:hypothetical protein